jgi:hypothetical protein
VIARRATLLLTGAILAPEIVNISRGVLNRLIDSLAYAA